MDVPAVRVERHDSALGWSVSAFRAPHPALAGCVAGEYQGWTECTRRPVVRREVPACIIPLILNIGAPFRLSGPGVEPALYFSFTGGLSTRHTMVEPAGMSCCLQVNLTPPGALRVFGMPLAELTNRTVAFDDVMGPCGRALVDRLEAAPGWEERFALIDAFLLRRLEASRALPPYLTQFWRRVQETGGDVAIVVLASEVGYSRRRLTSQVHEHLGLPPKALARIVRLNAAIRDAERDGGGSWGEIARNRGYFDQSHLVREFIALAGIPPQEFLRRRLPDGGTAG
jgi:AraC-like DNA-binding protein